ncbi:unnamed protein product [Cyclocybe aegerita]|uniref:SCP domain-containing protein n=1 Tax=Cyclocybe aegerita TaxID=1973307 RepID=A0A8S0VSD2_CYCAE|nr:unnamed protein product [Cyclocybe aegerita]
MLALDDVVPVPHINSVHNINANNCFLALSSLPSGLAGPACARKNYQVADCVQRCKSRWGWTGSLMGSDPWGPVVKKMDASKDLNAIVAQACGSEVPSTTTSSTSAHATSTTSSTEAVRTTSTSSTFTRSITTAVSSSTSLSSSTSSSVLSTSSSSAPSTTTSTSVAAQGFAASFRQPQPTTSSPPPPPTTTRRTTSTPAPPRTTPTPTPTPAAVVPPANTGSGGTSAADIQAYLAGHNTVRAQHGAAPLTWNDNLASKAQEWANGCQFKHSGGALGAFGENLAAGTGSSYSIAQAIKSWTDEVVDYNPNNPSPSHFTQVVWKGTTQVGCAVQSCSGIFEARFGPAKYFVCEYSPQGNIIGRFGENVQV